MRVCAETGIIKWFRSTEAAMGYLAVMLAGLYGWAVLWMWRVGRSGPRPLNALAETVVLLPLPIGLLVWTALRRRDEQRPLR